MSVTITLEDDIDISRGDMLVRSENRPEAQQDLDVMFAGSMPRRRVHVRNTS